MPKPIGKERMEALGYRFIKTFNGTNYYSPLQPCLRTCQECVVVEAEETSKGLVTFTCQRCRKNKVGCVLRKKINNNESEDKDVPSEGASGSSPLPLPANVKKSQSGSASGEVRTARATNGSSEAASPSPPASPSSTTSTSTQDTVRPPARSKGPLPFESSDEESDLERPTKAVPKHNGQSATSTSNRHTQPDDVRHVRATAPDAEADIRALRSQVQELREAQAVWVTEKEEREGRVNELEGRVEELEGQVEEFRAQRTQDRDKIARLKARLATVMSMGEKADASTKAVQPERGTPSDEITQLTADLEEAISQREELEREWEDKEDAWKAKRKEMEREWKEKEDAWKAKRKNLEKEIGQLKQQLRTSRAGRG